MAKKSKVLHAVSVPAACPVGNLYALANEMRQGVASMMRFAHEIQSQKVGPGEWKKPAWCFAGAFMAWFDSSHLLLPAHRALARGVYAPNASPIQLGDTNAKASMLEAMVLELGGFVRQMLYENIPTPLDPDVELLIGQTRAAVAARRATGTRAERIDEHALWSALAWTEACALQRRLGIRTQQDALKFMAKEWTKQGRSRAEFALSMLVSRFGSVDFRIVQVQLEREAQAALDAEGRQVVQTPNQVRGARRSGLPARKHRGAGKQQSVPNAASVQGADDWRHASWFRAVVKRYSSGKQFLKTSQLRRSAEQGEFKGGVRRVGKRGQRAYRIRIVCEALAYSSYAPFFQAAVKDGFNSPLRNRSRG